MPHRAAQVGPENVAETMAQYKRSLLVLCVALAAGKGAAGQAAPAAGPAANIVGPDIKLVNVDLSGTPFTSVQVQLQSTLMH